MEQRHEIKIEDLVQIDAEKYGILSSVVESRGNRNFSKFAVAELISGRKKRVVLTGEPGNGKTSLMYQLIGALEDNSRNLGQDIPFMVTQYESFLRGDIHYDDSPEMNREMIEQIRANEKNNPERRHFIEDPAVGMTDWKDRGVSAFNALLDDREDIDKTIFVRLLVNPLVQRRSAYLRDYVKDVPEASILSELNRLGVSLKGIGREGISPKKIKDIFAKMANEKQINQIRSEQNRLENNWWGKNVHNTDSMKSGLNKFKIDSNDFHKILGDFGMLDALGEDQARVMANITTDITVTQALRFEDEFNEKAIPSSSRAILFNPYNPKTIELDLSRYQNAA